MASKKKPCNDCGLPFNPKRLRKKQDKLLCYQCISNYRTMMPGFNKLKPPKDFLNSLAEKPKPSRLEPKIPNSNKKESRPIRLSISKAERDFMFKNNISKGLSTEQAKNRVNNTCEFQNNLKNKLKGKEKEKDRDINSNFKKSFNNLIKSNK